MAYWILVAMIMHLEQNCFMQDRFSLTQRNSSAKLTGYRTPSVHLREGASDRKRFQVSIDAVR